jgi:hypothetical protein
MAMDYHQSAVFSFFGGVLGDKVEGQIKTELG